LPDIATVVQGALDRFILDLVEAGFETSDGRNWTGPLDPELAGLTAATSMLLFIESGWPYKHPHLYVDGLRPSVHLNGTALCLWRVGDDSLAWLRLADLRERIAQWAERYRGRATSEDPILDPHYYWIPFNRKVLATVDLSKVKWGNGGSGETTAELKDGVLKIGEQGELRVRWYGRESMRHPPVNMEMVTTALRAEQARNLEGELEKVGRPGGLDYLMLIWGTPVGEPDVLVLRLSRSAGGEVVSEALEVARVDEDVLIRRAGPDAPTLRSKIVVVFGQGAVGSNVTMLLARSGVGRIVAVDGERLRPGDVVRHAASSVMVGEPKVRAVWIAAFLTAPWTTVRKVEESSWDPDRLAAVAEGADLVVDAVGESSFTEQLSRLLASTSTPLVSISLFRAGSLARLRVRLQDGLPIHERGDGDRFPLIPGGPLEEATWETGCAAPVNNAPPAAVMSAAALVARTAVEILTGREAASFDAGEVYRPLDSPPFDVVGYRRYE
jgi:molybdopterin/thiamine biosynthesis adenylyltransferase